MDTLKKITKVKVLIYICNGIINITITLPFIIYTITPYACHMLFVIIFH